LAVCLLGAAPHAAQAQATWTWVSGVGSDANPCSRTAPCQTLGGAISKTAASGEINCLDSSGIGPVTITKALLIRCVGVEAGVLVSGTNGITVNAGSTDTVTLDGLDIEGSGSAPNTSLNGVQFNSGSVLRVLNCTIRNFTSPTAGDGILFAPSTGTAKLEVINTAISENSAVGIEVFPSGSGSAVVSIDRTSVGANAVGIRANGNTTTGSIFVTFRDSVASDNTGVGINAVAVTAAGISVIVDHSSVVNNGTFGLRVAGALAVVRFGNSTISGNFQATQAISSGVLGSYGNNFINGNGTDTVPPVIPTH
jgi:hypothetical protein